MHIKGYLSIRLREACLIHCLLKYMELMRASFRVMFLSVIDIRRKCLLHRGDFFVLCENDTWEQMSIYTHV